MAKEKKGSQAKPTKAVKEKPVKEPRKPGLVSHAYEVLLKSKEPMQCGALVEAAKKNGWDAGNGKTPHASLAAAIYAEISKKGKKARFKKVSPGHYIAVAQK